MGTLAIGFQGLVAEMASAHHLTITATASCNVDGIPVIKYTATSWNQLTIAGSNAEIDILFNGVKVDAQAFTLLTTPKNEFSGHHAAPSATNTVDVEGVAIDDWGDGFEEGQTSTVTVTVPTHCAPGTGRFTGGGKDVVGGGVTVTKGFEVDCDLHQPSNNLEINWRNASGTHQFHMLDFLSAVCTLNGNPAPPKAPVNTIVASGTGRYDNVDGYTVQFTLIDNGEPGTNDKTGFAIFLTSPPHTVVLFFPVQTITSGNIQAHVDQK
jgi:hypothetical protein